MFGGIVKVDHCKGVRCRYPVDALIADGASHNNVARVKADVAPARAY